MVFEVPDFNLDRALPHKNGMFQPAEVREAGEAIRPSVKLEFTPEGKPLMRLVADTKGRVREALWGDIGVFQENLRTNFPWGEELAEKEITPFPVPAYLQEFTTDKNFFIVRSPEGSPLFFNSSAQLLSDSYEDIRTDPTVRLLWVQKHNLYFTEKNGRFSVVNNRIAWPFKKKWVFPDTDETYYTAIVAILIEPKLRNGHYLPLR